jgi:N-acetylglucosaminyl-diphospho-decaprenol L-rhamnosyltransferase
VNQLAVVIINYNTREQLRACLATVTKQMPSEVIVVDNNSSDGSAEMVQSHYPSVLLRANEINVGYGTAANHAIAGCTAKYVLLLNADTLLQPGALEAFSTYLDLHPRAAVLGPRLVDPDGNLQASCYPFPTPLDTFLENSTSTILLGRFIRRYVPGLRKLYLRTWPHDRARIVPWIKGAAVAVRRDAFEAVGGFDESFFMYFEDADLCFRLNAAGWQVHFAPVTAVVHVGGASTVQYRADMSVQLFASTVRFYQRHYPRARVAKLLLVVKTLMLAKCIGGSIHFCLAQDEKKRRELSESIAASRRVLLKISAGESALSR